MNAIIAYNVTMENGRSKSFFFFKREIREAWRKGRKREKSKTHQRGGISFAALPPGMFVREAAGYLKNGSIFRRSDIQRMARESVQRFDGLIMRSRETARSTMVMQMNTV